MPDGNLKFIVANEDEFESLFDLHQKHKPGDTYRPAAFVDQAGYEAALAELQADFDKKIKQQ